MAVLIQQMIVPDYSFVMHTVNPSNLNPRECLVELVVGLGETLASAACRGNPFRMVGDKESGQALEVQTHPRDAGGCPPASGLELAFIRQPQLSRHGTAAEVLPVKIVLEGRRGGIPVGFG